MNPPLISLRNFSSDQYILDKVFYHNCYRLPHFNKESSTQDKVVVDIGAHAGYFSVTALFLGYKVYAFEPVVDNLSVLLENTSKHINSSVFVFPVGVSTNNSNIQLLNKPVLNNSMFDFAYLSENLTQTHVPEDSYPISVFSLASLLRVFVSNHMIDYLKINLGYGEAFALTNHKDFSIVSNICGEFSLSEISSEGLSSFLKSVGFTNVLVEPINDDSRALFFASKGKLEDAFITS